MDRRHVWNPLCFKSSLSQTLKSLHCAYRWRQIKNYVHVYMKWKKDPFYDSIDCIHKSKELKRIISLKNFIARSPDGCIPITDVSKRGFVFDVKIRVASYLRQFPSIFEEFTGPSYNLPWFRLTREAVEIDEEERRVTEEGKDGLRGRLKKFISMSKEKALPLKIIQGMLWYLGLPEDFLQHPDENFDASLKPVDLEGGLKGLRAEIEGRILSVLQINAASRGLCHGYPVEPIEFPLFPSKGVRMKEKIHDWLSHFQTLPYVSPYEDYAHLDPCGEISEKRVVGVLHEVLSLFVEHAAERKKLLCLRKYFGLPQKVHKVFERYPPIFYLSLKNNTCTAILKEAYGDHFSIEKHPMSRTREKYVELLK